MGIEYILKIPEEHRARVAEKAETEIPELLERLDPSPGNNIDVSPIPEGLFVCDYLSNDVVAAKVFRAAISWLLRFSPQVIVEDA
jgi:hypothetical protein